MGAKSSFASIGTPKLGNRIGSGCTGRLSWAPPFPRNCNYILMKTTLLLGSSLFLVNGLAAQQMVPTSLDQTIDPNQVVNNPVPVMSRGLQHCDDFNRPTGSLGADWIPLGGAPDCYNDMFGSGSGNSYAQHANGNDGYDTVVISIDLPANPAGNLTYGAAVTGLGGADNLFTKVQSQSGTDYNFIGAYHGFNGGGWNGYGGFFAITPFAEGIVTFYVDNAGDQMNVDIDYDRDGVADDSYQFPGINAAFAGALSGTGVGVGAYGSGFGSCDDWNMNDGCGGPGGGCGIDQDQPNSPVYMKAFGQSDCAQSFQQTGSNICGAGIFTQPGVGTSGDVTLEIWDNLPNAGGTMLASGTYAGATPGMWVDVFFAATPVTPGTTYYMVMTCTDPSMGIAGDVNDPYPFGNVFANPGYGAFPSFDYTFRTYSDSGGGGPVLSVVGNCGFIGSGLLSMGNTPNGNVGFAWSVNTGPFVIGGAACAGTTIDLINPNVIAVVSADNNGDALVLPGNGIPAQGWRRGVLPVDGHQHLRRVEPARHLVLCCFDDASAAAEASSSF